ncbi:hypothetical protein [Streptomyces sp. NPDC007984]|uniref:hypothetical protein n=1 Tax=Streptomyces sp. NPDC007984 TaxID=3364801 RepID=UPI0036E7F3F7
MADDVKVQRSTELDIPAKNPLERGWRKAQLIRQLALGELTQTRLGELYGVSQASISRFAARYTGEIETVRYNLAEKVQQGAEELWVTQKHNRLAEYQDVAERMGGVSTPRAQEIRMQALRNVAEELGDLPARTQVDISTSTVSYQVVGIDPADI